MVVAVPPAENKNVPTESAHLLTRSPTECEETQFWWEMAFRCLPIGGPKTAVTPPKGLKCPDGWWWHMYGFCAPRQPLCDQGYTLNMDYFYCRPVGSTSRQTPAHPPS
ncbi:hypothetical protein RSAG8_09105, partial [Rhizoctonia solani AG-8 WAC10335]